LEPFIINTSAAHVKPAYVGLPYSKFVSTNATAFGGIGCEVGFLGIECVFTVAASI
jgi:hypothetical protein